MSKTNNGALSHADSLHRYWSIVVLIKLSFGAQIDFENGNRPNAANLRTRRMYHTNQRRVQFYFHQKHKKCHKWYCWLVQYNPLGLGPLHNGLQTIVVFIAPVSFPIIIRKMTKEPLRKRATGAPCSVHMVDYCAYKNKIKSNRTTYVFGYLFMAKRQYRIVLVWCALLINWTKLYPREYFSISLICVFYVLFLSLDVDRCRAAAVIQTVLNGTAGMVMLLGPRFYLALFYFWRKRSLLKYTCAALY